MFSKSRRTYPTDESSHLRDLVVRCPNCQALLRITREQEAGRQPITCMACMEVFTLQEGRR